MTSEDKFEKFAEIIDVYKKDYQHKLQGISLKILIFGSGFEKDKQCWKKSYSELCNACENAEKCVAKKRMFLREYIKNELINTAILIEELEFTYPYIDEENFIDENDDDIDLIFIFPESTGSIAEFMNFSKNESIVKKLRLFLPKRYHPLYCDNTSYTSYVRDSYLTYLTTYGHVYLYEDLEELKTIIKRYLENYQRVIYSKHLKK